MEPCQPYGASSAAAADADAATPTSPGDAACDYDDAADNNRGHSNCER